MTSARQVRPIFRQLTSRHINYKPAGGRFLCKTPVHHINCGIFIECSSNKDRLRPQWSVTPLFVYRVFHDIVLGTLNERLRRPAAAPDKLWLWSDPTMVGDLIEAIETVAMPKLAFYETLERYVTLPPETYETFGEAPEDLMLIHIALGDLDAARTIWHRRAPLYRDKSYQRRPRDLWLRHQLDTVEEPLRIGDRPALARILHGWEEANVRGTEIERYWEQTPFPLEL